MRATINNRPKQKEALCASLTATGRPCKLHCSAAWVPFCWMHHPKGKVECVGGGPLDGQYIREEYTSHDWPAVLVIGGAGAMVWQCQGLQGEAPEEGSIGIYRYGFRGLLPVWQWQAAD